MSDEVIYLWYFRSYNHISNNREFINWTLYEDSESIECAYQNYIFYKEQQCEDTVNTFQFKDSSYVIDFTCNIQIDTNNTFDIKTIGRFTGDPNLNRNLKSLLCNDKYMWYFNIGETVWAPFKLDENAQIESAYLQYSLSKGPPIFNGELYKIDFENFIEISIDQKVIKVSRSKECPSNLIRENYYNNDIKPQKSTMGTISEETVKNIKKDHFLKFKNIFPTKHKTNFKTITYFHNPSGDQIIIQISHLSYKENTNNENDTTAKIIEELESDGFINLGYITNDKSNNLINIKMNNFPPSLLKKIFKSNWYSRFNKENEYIWRKFNNEKNSIVEEAYKNRYLLFNHQEIEFDSEEKFKINFVLNKEIKNDIESTLMRFNIKNCLPDNIVEINVPEEILNKIEEKNNKRKFDHQIVKYANKFGPKSFDELLDEIHKELKDEATKLNLEKEFDRYDQNYLSKINSRNFINKIITIYTEEGYVYRRVNKILRDKEYNLFWGIKYYYFSLLLAIQNCFSLNLAKELKYLYRGLKLRPEQISFFSDLKPGNMILFNEFLSTTYNKDIANNYAKTGLGSFMFEIEIPEHSVIRIAKIESFSKYQNEKEVLLSSGCILEHINTIDENDISTIKFKLVASNYEAFSKFILTFKNTSINLKPVQFDYNGLNYLFHALNKNSLIKRIELMIYQDNMLSYFSRNIANNRFLNIIHLTKCNEIENNQSITFYLDHHSSLYLHNFTEKEFGVFISGFKSNLPYKFLYLNILQDTSLRYFKNLFESNQELFNLEMKTLNSQMMNPKSVKSLTKILKNSKIELLNLIDTSICEIGLTYMLEFLNQSNLKKIYFCIRDGNLFNYLGKTLHNNLRFIKIEVKRDLITLHKRKVKLIKKDKSQLDVTLINTTNEEFLSFITFFITKEKDIEHLDLSNNNINESFINFFNEYLTDNICLLTLNLSNNKIKDQGFIKIVEILKRNNVLSMLNLRKNKISNRGYEYIKELQSSQLSLNIYESLDNQISESQYYIHKTLTGHQGKISSMLILNNGMIASGSWDKTIKVWNPKDLTNCSYTLEGHTGCITSLQLLLNGHVVSSSADDELKVWDLDKNCGILKTVRAGQYGVYSLLVLRDGSIVSGSGWYHKSIKIWDFNFNCLHIINGHQDSISSLIELNGKLASGSKDKTVKIWDLNSNFECLYTLNDHFGSINSLIKDKEGRLISCSQDKTIKIWDPLNQFNCITTLNHSTESLLLLSDGKIVSGEEKSIIITNPFENYTSIKLEGHKGAITSLIELNDGKILSGSCDLTIKVWNPLSQYKYIKTVEYSGEITSLVKLNNSIIALSSGNFINIIDTNNKFEKIYTLIHDDKITIMLKIKDIFLLSLSNDGIIKKWNVINHFDCVLSVKFNHDLVSSLICLSDGKLLSASSDCTIKIWDTNFNCIQSLHGHSKGVTSLAKFKDGRIVSSSYDQTIKLWDNNNNYACVITQVGHKEYVVSLLVLSSGHLASCSADKSIKLWKVTADNMICIQSLECHLDVIYSLKLLSDGKIISFSKDKTAKIWELNDNLSCIQTINLHIHSLICLNDGNIIFSQGNFIYFWTNK